MPITTVYDSTNYSNTVEAILREHILDYFASSDYVTTFDQPTVEAMSKPIIWLSLVSSRNLDRLRTRRSGKSLQRKELNYAVNLFTNPSTGAMTKIRQMAATFERNAIQRDGYKLHDAGLVQAEVTPFTTVIVDSEQKYYRRLAVLSVAVYVETS